jgi:acyl dehydratase
MTQPKWHYEDFEVGKTIEVGKWTLTEEEVLDFATKFDPQPFHVDKAAAEKSIYGGIIASGWHTCGIMMRLMVDNLLRDSSSMGSPGLDEVRWIKPVRPGDTLTVSTTTLEARPSTSKPDRGIVVTQWEARNQHGELVATVKGMSLFKRRPQP